MFSMDKKGKIALPGTLGTLALVAALIRTAAGVTGEADDVSGFFGHVGAAIALFIGDPLAWCGILMVGIVAIVCRSDIRAWWNERSGNHSQSSNGLPVKPSEDEDRLRKAKERISDLIREIPAPPRIGGEPAFSLNPHAIAMEAMFGKVVKDWKAETLAGVQGLLNATIVDRYSRCLQQENPQSAAKNLLESVRLTFTLADLRGVGQPDPKEEAKRLLREREYHQELSFAQQSLQDKVERRNKIQAGMIWLVDEAETDRNAYTPNDGNAWVQCAYGFINKLVSTHRTRWGCGSSPSFDEFRIAVASFRAVADNLQSDDMPD